MKDQITFDDFMKLDIRVGTVIAAEPVDGSEKLLRLEIDLGEEQRQVIAGIAKVIDDLEGKTLFSFSSRDKAFEAVKPQEGKTTVAEKMGEFYGEKLKEQGIDKISFDRGGYLYHGRVRALAEALRKAGIDF